MKSKKNYIYFLLFAVFMILIHVYIKPVFGDEIHFRAKLISYHYDILSLLKWRWMNWSSRFILEFPMYLMAVLPSILWKIIDCICFIAVFYMISIYTDEKLFLLTCICSYPLIHLASAGWIATTTNYLWPFTAGLAAFYLFMKLVSQADLNVPQFLLYSLLLIYATNSELISCLFLLAVLLFFVYDHLFYYRRRLIKNRKVIIWSLLLSIAGIVNVLICPGNQNRIAKEITQWMPDYAQLSFFRKLQLCVVSTIQHFTSIPNMIFLLLGFLIACIIISDQRFNLLYKLIGTVPFVISLLLTAYYGWFNILKKHNLNYVLPEVTMKSSSQILMQMILFVLSVIYLICMLISIFYIFRDDTKYGVKQYEQSFCLVSIYFGGLISRFTLLFSPTMLASGTRIYFIFYMAQIWILSKLFEKIKSQPLRILCYIICIAGIIVNLIMLYMLQRKYI